MRILLRQLQSAGHLHEVRYIPPMRLEYGRTVPTIRAMGPSLQKDRVKTALKRHRAEGRYNEGGELEIGHHSFDITIGPSGEGKSLIEITPNNVRGKLPKKARTKINALLATLFKNN